MQTRIDLTQPLPFHPNRVWRCYTGGALLDRFRGDAGGGDGDFPEDWLASTTVAMNGPHQQHPEEGLSRLRLDEGRVGPLLRDVVLEDPDGCLGPGGDPDEGVGVLCKFLDSAIRLPIQCHPDRAFAREHYASEHGKTECWFILDTREVDGEEPYVLLGFKPDTSEAAFRQAVEAQDMATATAMLHRVPVAPGDAFFIPGRMPHAIGSGVFLLEVQEPTDWVVQPERFVGHTELSATDMWGPLTPELGMRCFDYAGAAELEAIRQRTALPPHPLVREAGGTVTNLVGPATTDCFRVDRLDVTGSLAWMPPAPFHIVVVVAGSGSVEAGGTALPLRRGDTLFVPHAVDDLHYRSDGDPLVVYAISSRAG